MNKLAANKKSTGITSTGRVEVDGIAPWLVILVACVARGPGGRDSLPEVCILIH